MIAALFVAKDGAYFGLPDVDPWDEARVARTYAGPHPVVAHPPCSRWCRLAGLVEKRWGHKRGEDGGCFKAALNAVRTYGGVLEHPAWTDAWPAFGLAKPIPGAGWMRTLDGGWVCHVEQHHYGHPAKKATWLYAYGLTNPPQLNWGIVPDNQSQALVSWCGNRTRPRAVVGSLRHHGKDVDPRPRLNRKAASATPPAFREVLLQIARSVKEQRK